MDELIEEARRAANEIGSTRFEVRPDTVEAAAQPTLKEFPHLGNDIQIWVDVLGDLTGCDAVGVRMSRMTQAMCPRLHVDRVMLRLVMTYVGPGTEFVPEEHVDRRYLGGSGLSTRDEVGGLLRIPDCVQHARVFDLVALKGELWPENEGRGAVHRSPALDDAVSRFVMTLDPLYHD